MSTNTALDQIKNRVEGATEGPWTMDADSYHVTGPNGEGITYDLINGETGEFIAHTRNDVPKLLAALEAVEGLLAGWEEQATGKSSQDYTLRAAVTQIRTAITEALR